MLPENAAALVGAGLLSVLIFPMLARMIHRPEPTIDEPLAGAGPA